MSRKDSPSIPHNEGDVARQQRLLSTSRLLDHEAFISAFQSWEGPTLDPTEPDSTEPDQTAPTKNPALPETQPEGSHDQQPAS